MVFKRQSVVCNTCLCLQRVSGSGGSNTGAWLQCTHVAEGHAGAALALAATSHMLYSGGVGKQRPTFLIFWKQNITQPHIHK